METVMLHKTLSQFVKIKLGQNIPRYQQTCEGELRVFYENTLCDVFRKCSADGVKLVGGGSFIISWALLFCHDNIIKKVKVP